MSDIDEYLKSVDQVCRRPNCYGHGTFDEVCAYIAGYSAGFPASPIRSGADYSAFNSFVASRHRFPQKYHWSYVIKKCTSDDAMAIERLRQLLTEFGERSRSESSAAIAGQALAEASSMEEGEPEKAWRAFSRVFLRGKREQIEPLILSHPDAEILWSRAYPTEVASQLEEICDGFLVSRIPGNKDDSHVKVITPDFGPVSVHLVDGQWKADVTPIIECWKSRPSAMQRPG
jgi:hypothetical protein